MQKNKKTPKKHQKMKDTFRAFANCAYYAPVIGAGGGWVE